MKIAIGSDHGGFALKQELIPFIEKLGFDINIRGDVVYFVTQLWRGTY